jgi:hypothetical protein
MIPASRQDQECMGEADKKKAGAQPDHPAEESAPSASPPSVGEQAARSVMHPESFDPEWRYYHGAWGG